MCRSDDLQSPSFYLQKNAQNRASTKFSPASTKCLLTSILRELTFAVHGVDGAGEGGPAGRKPASNDPS
jgi:hypothetical protein